MGRFCLQVFDFQSMRHDVWPRLAVRLESGMFRKSAEMVTCQSRARSLEELVIQTTPDRFSLLRMIPPGHSEAHYFDTVLNSPAGVTPLYKPMIQQTPVRELFFIVTTLVAVLSVGCKNDQSQAEWWQGEQERIALMHQVELKQYRISQTDVAGFDEVQRLGKLTESSTELLGSLNRQRQVLTEELSLLERNLAELKEATIRDQRNRAIGRTFKSFESASGRKFEEVSVAAIDDAGVTIRHADGSARLRFADLDPEQQVFFGLEADLAFAAEEKESRAAVAYEREIDNQMAVLREQEDRTSQTNRRVELASKRKSSLLAAQQVAETKAGPLAKAATPFGSRSWGYSRYSSSYSSYRDPAYRTYSPTYRYVYNYVVPRYNSYCPPTPITRSAGTVGSGYVSPPVSTQRRSFANTTLPYIP